MFPRVWVGFAIAAIVLLLELSTGFFVVWEKSNGQIVNTNYLIVATFVLYLAGWFYWYRWVYRIHKVLREATESKYPISPRKAVGYQFIPLYSVVWNFEWPNRIADFVRKNPSSGVHMRKGWVGFWLLFASLLGSLDKGLQLVLLFTIGAYLARKIRRVMAVQRLQPMGLTTFAAAPPAVDESAYARDATVPVLEPMAFAPAAAASAHAAAPAAAWDLRMSREWRLPVSSGIGAAFGFLMCYGIWFLLSAIEQKGGITSGLATEGIKILLVAIVLYFFLEPLVDLLLKEFDVLDEPIEQPKLWQKLFRFGVFVVIVDVAHSLLERAAEEGGGFKVASLGILLTLFFGGMTYLWISGAPKRLREALAVVGPGMVLLLIFGAVVVAEARQLEDKFTETIKTSSEGSVKEGLRELGTGPPGAQEFAQEIADSKTVRTDGINGAWVLGCAVFVALGGFAAMRKNLGRVGVAGTVFVASLLSAAALSLIPYTTLERFYIVITLWSAFWWCFGLLAFYDHNVFQTSGEIALDAPPEPRLHESLPRPVWLVSCLILFGLIAAAYHFRPHGKEIAAPTLNVIADDKERPYGVVNPELTFHTKGLEPGEARESTFSGEPSLCSAAGLDSAPGEYPIAIGPGSGELKEEKYRVHFIAGKLKVVQATTSTNLRSSAAVARLNSPVTLTAAIAPQYAGTPTGRVDFFVDERPAAGTVALSSGTATHIALGLPAGEHVVKARYSGDANFKGSDSTFMQQILPPEPPPRVPTAIVIPAGTEILVATVEPIDSVTTKAARPLMASLAAPLAFNGRILAPRGATAILAITDIDSGGFGGKPGFTIHLARLDIAGKSYQISSRIRMQGSTVGRFHIAGATVLSFKLESPITTDVLTLR